MEKIFKEAKNIIFDFGGVIINVDFELTYKAFEALGIYDVREWFKQNSQTELFYNLETGKISPSEFRNSLCSMVGKQLSNEVFDKAWNALLLEIPKKRIELLEGLKKKYRIFLLSNTNKIHYDSYLSEFQKKYNYKSFDDLFEKAWFSHEIGMAKPFTETFIKVLNEKDLRPEETVFIDDTYIHIEGAQKAGLKTFFLDLKKGMEITEVLKEE
ncbi:MAG: HAD family phosphatase [Bacteroidales bacterium]|nr:HAD family phosphatase [Bacteroidales bacterium]